MRFPLATMAVLTLATCAHAGNHGFPTDWRPGGPPLDLSAYRMSFHDEFDSTAGLGSAQASTPWEVGRHSVLNKGEKMAWAGDPEAYTTEGGVLTLATRYSRFDGRYVEADIETRRSFGPNAYFEVRMQGPQVDGVHSGVWVRGEEHGQGHPEIDLVEQYGPEDPFDHSSSHTWAHGGPHVFTSTLTPRPEGRGIEWHTYGLLATDDAFTVYRDGKPLKTIARLPAQRVPLYLLISLFGNKNPPPATLKVDWARVYEPR